MCRLLAYLGPPLQLDRIVIKPPHSLVVQSYAPQEMQEALLNADGFGLGWYHRDRAELPYLYKNTCPIWNDVNLPHLTRYVETRCMVGYVRSATPGLAVDLGNCQPFSKGHLLFSHNGYIDRFRHTLRRPIRNLLSEKADEWVQGSTDSEYLYALVLTYLAQMPLEEAIAAALHQIGDLARSPFCKFTATTIASTGDRLIACRYANFDILPTLYWLQNDPHYPEAVILASEPLFAGNWQPCPPQSRLIVEPSLDVTITPL
ncbi:ergothioneine biosynthesis protein EgtC [Spirulina major CS-329]|uniref:ergothioneine biosynthesis protein EgtC n=1 Tax=Spirulina TaxID=1154 RepID=UPI00232AE60F|nr:MULTISPECIES: ergothioneine biosynthesis protein EgtC [Spirulina]MDB9494794.1 ergothioneine biosynthesis protein EgtC [Spirulina subsalsa CS-330]MDB9504393.1 ergothioneine biosynthesis protein EgtC [Spirulina major CS-329]